MDTQPTKRKPWIWAAVMLVLAVHFALLFFSASQKSVTSDEPYHIARGTSALFSGDFRMSVAHPPLVNLITALPMLFYPDFQAPLNDRAWHNPKVSAAERKFRFSKLLLQVRGVMGWRGNPEPLRIVKWCRVSVMVMSVALALLVFIWAKNTFGELAGLFALALYCFSPTVIAHARLVTTEIGSTLFIFLFAMALSRHLSRPSWKTLIACGVTFGLAQLSKYTAILLIPLVPIILVMAKEGTIAQRIKKFFALNPKAPEFMTGLGAWIVMMIVCAVVIWAGYGFETTSIHVVETPESVPLSQTGYYIKRIMVWLMANVPVPPRTYYYGLSRTLMDTAAHFHPLYFMGEVSEKGWWYYYPVLFVIKEPLAFLALIVMAIASAKKGPKLPRADRNIIAVLSVGMALFFMFLNQKNIGIRHLLPLYPFLFVWLSRLAEEKAWRKVLPWGAWALVAAYAINAFVTYPDYLVHFNSLVGGPDGGLKYSVVGEDWGQDVSALGKFCQENNIQKIHYNPYGNAEPGDYNIPRQGFKCNLHEPGWYAFHIVDMLRPKNDQPPDCYNDFKAMEPEAVLHHTIYVYRLESPEKSP